MSMRGHRIAGEARARHLRLIALEQHDLDGQMRLLVKIAPHSFPDRDHLRIVRDGPHPDCSLMVTSFGTPSTERKRSVDLTSALSPGLLAFALKTAAFPESPSR